MAARLRTLALFLFALPLLGMGMLGGGAAGVPERNYQGTFLDRDGTRVTARLINANGELALSGELGRGTVRISFDNIQSIEFAGDGDKGLIAKVHLKKGDPVELKVRGSLAFSGQTDVGVYQIRARDLKSLELQS